MTSTPEGASIFIDGEDTGQVTPASVVGVPPAPWKFPSCSTGYLVSPAAFTATVIEGQANEVPDDTFVLRAIHTVLFEGFSNVSCQGCPDMALNMADFMHRPGYGLDEVLYIKYSIFGPRSTTRTTSTTPPKTMRGSSITRTIWRRGFPWSPSKESKSRAPQPTPPTTDEAAAFCDATWPPSPVS